VSETWLRDSTHGCFTSNDEFALCDPDRTGAIIRPGAPDVRSWA
jgi:hypothetical protein